MNTPPPPGSAPNTPPARRTGWRRGARVLWVLTGWAQGWVLGLLGGAVALVAALLLTGWFWSASPQSLAQTLQWSADWLADPATGQRPLTAEGVEGNLRTGGTVARLRWQRNGLDVELHHLTLRWPAGLWPDALLRQRLALDGLAVGRLRIRDERPDTPPEPLTPPTTLALPWLRSVALPLQIDTLQWDGASPITLGPLQARYGYGPEPGAAGLHHTLALNDLQWSGGHYRLQARVQAEADLALQATLTGRLRTTPPGAARAWPLLAQATLQGTLAGPAAEVRLSARVSTPDAHLPAARQPHLQADATLHPWATLPVRAGELSFAHLDLASLWPSAPSTQLHGAWTVRSAATPSPTPALTPAQALAHSDWQLRGQLRNERPGPLDRQRLPLEQLQTALDWQAGQWHLRSLSAALAGGTLQAQGSAALRDGQLHGWQGQLQATGLHPARVWSSLNLQPTDLELTAQHTGTDPASPTAVRLDVRPSQGNTATRLWPAPQLQAAGTWQAGALALQTWRLHAWGAEWDASGTLHPARRAFDGRSELRLPGAQLGFDGSIAATAPTNAQPPGRASQAQWQVHDAAALQRWLVQTATGLDAAWPDAGLRPRLLTPLQAWAAQGSARVTAQWSGRAPWWGPAAGPSAEPWSVDLTLPDLTLRAAAPAQDTPALALQWQGWGVQVQGRSQDWQLRHTGHVTAHTPGARWEGRTALTGQGTLARDAAGLALDARLDTLNLQLSSSTHPLGLRVEAAGPIPIQRNGQGDLMLPPASLRLTPVPSDTRTLPAMANTPMTLSWGTTRWAQGQWHGQGQWQGLALSWLNAWFSHDAAPQGPMQQAGLVGDLLLDGQWDLALPVTAPSPAGSPPARARVSLRRASGDLTLRTGDGPHAERQRAGLGEVSLALQLDGTALQGQLRWASQHAGDVHADLRTTLQPPTGPDTPWHWSPQAPLSGQLQAQLPQIGLWSSLAPPGWRLSGRLQANASLGGTRERPEWRGQLQADDLTLRSLLDGLDFSDGQLRATLAGETLTIDSLRLRGAGGEAGGLLTGQGTATWPLNPRADTHRREPAIDLTLHAQRLRLLARADRRLTLSGDLQAQLRGQRLDLTGRLVTDQALLLLPDESTPALSRDVVVRGTERPPGFGAGSPVQTQLRVDWLLGDDFHVRGLGIDTYLTGRLRISATPTQRTPQLTGQVQTVRGSYRAYGQALTIEEGQVRFNGPVDNPSLDILALRPHPTQRVGVEIGGTAQAPRVRLYAEPDLPDSEKLAWLVLGRPASGTGAEAAVLQQAALALLSGGGSANDGSFTRALGLDELSFQGESSNTDGSTSAAALTLGKRISDQLYVSYTRSVVGALGTVAVFYDVSRYVTLRAQAGDDNALDLVFTHTYDGQTLPPRTRSTPAPDGSRQPRTMAPASP